MLRVSNILKRDWRGGRWFGGEGGGLEGREVVEWGDRWLEGEGQADKPVWREWLEQ